MNHHNPFKQPQPLKTMKILWLGYEENPALDFLRAQGEEVITKQEKVSLEDIQQINPDRIISYGYRHIIGDDILNPEVIQTYPDIINLHISLLPWNRCADPNFWSWLQHTPKGVTIIKLDPGIDTGPILVQEQIQFSPDETLTSSYDKLRQGIESLFIRNWPAIRDGKIEPKPQAHKGTMHSVKDLEKYKFLMEEKEWDTPVKEIEAYGKENGLWRSQDE